MALTLNGSANTIGGLAVGGLPDGIVDTDMLATDAVTAVKIGAKVPVSYALIVDKKDADTDGGTFSSGAWRTRDLNTILVNEDSICAGTSGNDSFTLIAGTYLIKWSAPAYEVQHHTTKLHDQTADTVIAKGTAAYDQSGYSVGRSWGSHVVTITSNNDYKIKHKCYTSRNTDGFGQKTGFQDEYYTMVEVWRYA